MFAQIYVQNRPRSLRAPDAALKRSWLDSNRNSKKLGANIKLILKEAVASVRAKTARR